MVSIKPTVNPSRFNLGELIYTPKGELWINGIEQIFSNIQRAETNNSSFKTIKKMIEATSKYIEWPKQKIKEKLSIKGKYTFRLKYAHMLNYLSS